MTIKFKDASEYAKVEAGRKKAGRPQFFNANTERMQEISADFEAVLLLLPASVKQEARQRLEAMEQPIARATKRDAVLAAALAVDRDNAEAQLTEAKQDIEKLQNFKSAFSNYAGVAEVGLFLRDAQLDMEETVMVQERAQNLKTVTAVLSQRALGNTDNLNRERRSWVNVLLAYAS